MKLIDRITQRKRERERSRRYFKHSHFVQLGSKLTRGKMPGVRGTGEKEWPTVGKLFVACFARSRFLKDLLLCQGAWEEESEGRVNPGCSGGETRLQILKEPTRALSRSLNSNVASPGIAAYRPCASGHSKWCSLRSTFAKQTSKTGISTLLLL